MHLNTPIKIGDIEFRNRVLLAPMSGVSDAPFRRLSWEHGAGMVVSEMVASSALLCGNHEMTLKAASAGLPVHMVQIAGREAEWMSKATVLCENAGADIVDINMGCPAKRVTTGYSGSALMRDLDHALSLIDAVVGAVKVPVTLKMRLGWDEHSINAPELARRAVDAGVQMITVHGRTRNQFYKGKADWQKVRAVREVIKVPLVVNGDICDGQTAQSAIKSCGADMVMVGRASYGAPWLPGLISGFRGEPDSAELLEIVSKHYADILSFYGHELGIRHARKHLGWYLEKWSAHPELNQLRGRILTGTDEETVIRLTREALAITHCGTQKKVAA